MQTIKDPATLIFPTKLDIMLTGAWKCIRRPSTPAFSEWGGNGGQAVPKNMKTNTPTILTEADLREAFWADHPALDRQRHPASFRQNHKSPMCRTAFVDYVDYMEKSGHITPGLAQTATL